MPEKFKIYIQFIKKYYIILLLVTGLFIIAISGNEKNDRLTASFDHSHYAQKLEQKISTIISMMDGAGECEVVVNIDSSSVNEKTKEQIIPAVSGVAIICDGGNDINIKNSIINAVSTLLGIGSNKVCVIAKAN